MSSPEKQLKILVIDDEKQIRRALKSILATRKFEVEVASSGEEGLDVAIDFAPDLIILDMSMPGMDGLEVCRTLRSWYESPILILSVKSGDEDKIAALDIGADDYITKPFSAGELIARVQALFRRSKKNVISAPIVYAGDIEIDLPHRVVKQAGQEVSLTRIEFDILAFLSLNANYVVTSKMLLEQVWGPGYGEDSQTLRVHVSHLRKKIEPHPSVPRYILTEPGIGFRFSTV